jgi:hypothetical protein
VPGVLAGTLPVIVFPLASIGCDEAFIIFIPKPANTNEKVACCHSWNAISFISNDN